MFFPGLTGGLFYAIPPARDSARKGRGSYGSYLALQNTRLLKTKIHATSVGPVGLPNH